MTSVGLTQEGKKDRYAKIWKYETVTVSFTIYIAQNTTSANPRWILASSYAYSKFFSIIRIVALSKNHLTETMKLL
jgi:hypothetical protein